MPHLRIILTGDEAFEDLKDHMENVTHLQNPSMAMARLTKGMISGKSAVAIRINLPDGKVLIAETSMDLFLAAANVFEARERAEGLR